MIHSLRVFFSCVGLMEINWGKIKKSTCFCFANVFEKYEAKAFTVPFHGKQPKKSAFPHYSAANLMFKLGSPKSVTFPNFSLHISWCTFLSATAAAPKTPFG